MQTRELPEHNPALKHQVLCLLDELTALGRIPILAEAISYLPGYNVRVVLVIQAYSQLREVYGPNAADTMMKSLAARVLYAPKDYAEASEISEELGYTTVRVKSLSRPRVDAIRDEGDEPRQRQRERAAAAAAAAAGSQGARPRPGATPLRRIAADPRVEESLLRGSVLQATAPAAAQARDTRARRSTPGPGCSRACAGSRSAERRPTCATPARRDRGGHRAHRTS